MWGNNTLFGAVAAVMIFGPVEWFDWQYGFYIAAGIYFVGLLVSLLIPGKPASRRPWRFPPDRLVTPHRQPRRGGFETRPCACA